MPSTSRRPARLLLLGIACALLPTAGASAGPIPPCSGPPALTLVWHDVFGELADRGAAAAEEVQRRFCEMGVPLAWRLAAPGSSFSANEPGGVPVVVLQEHPVQQRRAELILGGVPVEATTGARPVWLYVRSIRRAAGLRPRDGLRVARTLSRALARVAVHELVHSLAPLEDHARDGLMRSSLGKRQLVGEDVPIGNRHADAVRAALAPGGWVASAWGAGREPGMPSFPPRSGHQE